MLNFDADAILSNRNVPAGATIKTTQDKLEQSVESVRQVVGASTYQSGVDVELSPAAMKISQILHNAMGGKEGAVGFDDFLESLHKQITEQGVDAEILKISPDGSSPERLALSKQAVNYLLTSYYGLEGLYTDA